MTKIRSDDIKDFKDLGEYLFQNAHDEQKGQNDLEKAKSLADCRCREVGTRDIAECQKGVENIFNIEKKYRDIDLAKKKK